MATQAEKVVVELLAKSNGFDARIKQSASSFGSGMSKMEQAAEQVENALEELSVAQARHSQQVESYRKQLNAGQISQERFNAEILRSKTALAQAEAGYRAANLQLNRANKGTAAASQQSRLLGYQIADIGTQLSAGTNPFLVLAQQAPQVANALEGAKGAVGRLATFLSGPLGAAALAAATVLSILIAKNVDFGNAVDDAVDSLREQYEKTKDAEEAQEIFGNTVEGVAKALDDNREALEKLNKVQDTSAEAAYKAAEAQRQKALRIRETTVALLEQAKAEFAAVASNPAAAGGLEGQAIAVSVHAERVEEITAQLAQAEANLAEARRQTVEARAAVIVDQATASAEEKINRRYDLQIDKARKAAIASGTVETALRKEIEAIEAARDAELKRIRDTERASRNSGLPQVTGREVAAALGTTITSGTRTAAQNKAVGGSANSYHLSGQAIDIPLTVNGKPLTKAGIRAALEPLGIQIKELLGPGDKNHDDHFHIAFDKRRLGADSIAENQQKAAEAEEKRQQAFQNELASLLSDEIDARQALINNAEELARLELEAIEISRKKYNDNLTSLIATGKLREEEAKQLRDINDERAKLRAELVKRREDERRFRMAEADLRRGAEFASAERSNLADILEGQADLATTQKERRDLERRLLELQFAEEKARNDYLIGYYDRLKLQDGITESELKEAAAAAEIAALRNSSLEQRQANAQARSDRSTEGPLGNFFGDIPSTADEINEALESVAAGGLATFTDALTDAIVNFRSLGDVGLAVLQNLTAGLVRMAIQQVILRTIGQTAGTAAIAATSAQAGAAAAAWAPAAALASLATLGTNAGPAAVALSATTALSQALAATSAIGRKDGGPIFGPGGPRDDKVRVDASNGEYMIQASSVAKLGRAKLDFINRTGELPGYADGGLISSVRPSNASAAAPGGDGGGLSEASLRRLEGALREAASARTPVSLYPTLSPKKAMEAMLSDPGAQRVFFDFTSQNSGKFRSSLNV